MPCFINSKIPSLYKFTLLVLMRTAEIHFKKEMILSQGKYVLMTHHGYADREGVEIRVTFELPCALIGKIIAGEVASNNRKPYIKDKEAIQLFIRDGFKSAKYKQ